MFLEQFPDEASYSSEFENAELFAAIVAEDILRDLATRSDDTTYGLSRYRNLWFGRSAWRYRRGEAVANFIQDQTANGAAWPPLAAGLFGGSFERATDASNSYAEKFKVFVGTLPW